MNLRETAQGTLIEIHVKPQSKQFKIEVEEDELLVFCRESPVKGRVNKELTKELSRLFKRRVQILSGSRSRQKKLLIENARTQEVNEILSRACLEGLKCQSLYLGNESRIGSRWGLLYG